MNGSSLWRLGAAAALTAMLLYVVCAAAVALWPDGALDFFNTWFHGLDLRLLKPPGGRPLTITQFLAGLLNAAIAAFAVAATFAAVFNLLSRPSARE